MFGEQVGSRMVEIGHRRDTVGSGEAVYNRPHSIFLVMILSYIGKLGSLLLTVTFVGAMCLTLTRDRV